jgi:hypothetical protein
MKDPIAAALAGVCALCSPARVGVTNRLAGWWKGNGGNQACLN